VWSPTELAAWQAMASAEEAADCLAGVAVTIAVAELGGAPPLAATRRRTREGGVEANRQGPNFACRSIFRPRLDSKNFQLKMSHRILRHMHGSLNIDEKKLIAQLGEKSRDESFKPN